MILLAARVLYGRSDQPLVGGMDVVVRRNAFGRQVDSFEGVVEINGLGAGLDPGPMPAVFIRAPVVESIGADVEVLGRVLSLIHISEPTRRTPISYAVFCLKKKKKERPDPTPH